MEFDHSTDTISPDDQAIVTMGGTGGLKLPIGTTAQRSGDLATVRWNTDVGYLEVYNSSGVWSSTSPGGIGHLGKFKSVTNNQAASDPGAGKLKWNNATQSSSTAIYIDSITDGGVDTTNYFNAVKVPSILYIQDMDDSSIFQRWTVTSIVDSTGWFTFSVTYIDGSGTFGNNKNIVIALSFNSAAGAGTVTSVGLTSSGTYSAAMTIGSSPVTTSGNITITPNLFGAAAAGIVPLSGGGTTNFLRADGTWAAPSAGGGVTSLSGTSNQITASASTGAVTLSTPSTFIAPGSVQVTTALYQPIAATVSAAGSTQGTATAITSRYNIVTTVAASTGVVLPLPVSPFGSEVMVSNRGANPLNVYPNSGAAITNGSTNAAIVLQVGSEVTLVSSSTTQWWITEPVITAGSNITLTPSSSGVTISSTAAPAGSTKEVQYNNAGVTAGAGNVEIDNNDLCLINNASPVTPPADNVKLFGKKLAQRMLPASVGPSGLDAAIQPAVWRQKIGVWSPPGNATTLPGVFGTTAWTAVGTATARTVATTNLLTRMRRLGYVSSSTAGSLTSIRTAVAQYTTGTGSGLGGFFSSFRFAITDAAAVSGARFFVGYSSATGVPTNVEPSALTNAFGVAQLSSSSTQLYFVYGGSAAQTAIALGTGFPPMASAGAANGIPYDLTLFCPPGSNGVVHYELFRLDTNTSVAGTITPGTPGTQTPANTTLLNPVMWRCNNATALAVGMDLINYYIETDY